MLERCLTYAAVVLLAITPAVRALCDVSCVTSSAAKRHAPMPPDHCASVPDAPVPAPADGCGHDHGRFASVVAAKAAVSVPALACAACTPGASAVAYAPAVRASFAGAAPPVSPPRVPLRI